MKERNNKSLVIVAQHFYGNRTMTEIRADEVDSFILQGLYDRSGLGNDEKHERSIIRVPGSENLVFVYNKYYEHMRIKELYEFIHDVNFRKIRFNPSVVIPEMDIVLFSRCIVCRMNDEGELESLEKGDVDLFIQYLVP